MYGCMYAADDSVMYCIVAIHQQADRWPHASLTPSFFKRRVIEIPHQRNSEVLRENGSSFILRGSSQFPEERQFFCVALRYRGNGKVTVL